MSGKPARRPVDRWGWHPLTDTWARRIVAAAQVGEGDLVLDIGAGTGALTRPMLRVGVRVIAVELDPGRCARLRELADDVRRRDDRGQVGRPGRLTVVAADARDLRLPRRPFRVVASPPYDGSSAILGRLLASGSRLRTADLVVERGLAERFVAGRASGAGRWRRTFALQVVRRLPRSAFVHPPRVDSVVLRVTRR